MPGSVQMNKKLQAENGRLRESLRTLLAAYGYMADGLLASDTEKAAVARARAVLRGEP
jgi:hypothetical protein